MANSIPTLSKFYKAKMVVQYFDKGYTASGRSKWVLTKTEGPRIISHEHYNNIVLAVPYFKKKIWAEDKSREYLKYSFTKAGYIATRNISINPSGDKRIVRYFEIIDAEPEDQYKRVASEIFNVPIDQVTNEMRRQAKRATFGLIYKESETNE